MTNNDGRKGDAKRPLTIPEEQFNANWDAIFNKPPSKLTEKILKQVHESIKGQTKWLKDIGL